LKRRSSTNAPPDPIFFTDRDLGKLFPQILREAGVRVERHDDHFVDTTTDEEWLEVIGTRGWVALTHNERIRYTPLQRDTLMQAGVRTFILIGRAPLRELAENFAQSFDRIRRFLAKHPEPFIAKVKRQKAGVELWLSHEEWLGLQADRRSDQ